MRDVTVMVVALVAVERVWVGMIVVAHGSFVVEKSSLPSTDVVGPRLSLPGSTHKAPLSPLPCFYLDISVLWAFFLDNHHC